MIRYPIIVLLCLFSFSSAAQEIDNIVAMSKVAKLELLDKYKIQESDHLVLTSVSLEDKEKDFHKNVLGFRFVDISNHSSDQYSKYTKPNLAYFSLVTGKIVHTGTSTNGTYKPLNADDYYQ